MRRTGSRSKSRAPVGCHVLGCRWLTRVRSLNDKYWYWHRIARPLRPHSTCPLLSLPRFATDDVCALRLAYPSSSPLRLSYVSPCRSPIIQQCCADTCAFPVFLPGHVSPVLRPTPDVFCRRTSCAHWTRAAIWSSCSTSGRPECDQALWRYVDPFPCSHRRSSLSQSTNSFRARGGCRQPVQSRFPPRPTVRIFCGLPSMHCHSRVPILEARNTSWTLTPRTIRSRFHLSVPPLCSYRPYPEKAHGQRWLTIPRLSVTPQQKNRPGYKSICM